MLNVSLASFRDTFFTQHLVNRVALSFYFDLVQSFYFLKGNRYLSSFLPELRSLIYLLITLGSIYQFTESKISGNKNLKNWMHGCLEFQSNKIKNTLLINVNYFLNWFCRNSPLSSLLIKIWFLLFAERFMKNFQSNSTLFYNITSW